MQFTEEDFDQVLSGNFVTKVIYLPDPEFQELALAGVETLVSTRLDPGVDPIAEADRRGSILAILRMGNKDLRSRPGMVATSPSRSCRRLRARTTKTASDQMPRLPAGYEATTAVYNASGDVRSAATAVVMRRLRCRWLQAAATAVAWHGNMPMGMPTAGFAPPAMPPNMIAGGRSGACRSPARRSACPARRTFRSAHRPACSSTS